VEDGKCKMNDEGSTIYLPLENHAEASEDGRKQGIRNKEMEIGDSRNGPSQVLRE
jgi:hypothetical protein